MCNITPGSKEILELNDMHQYPWQTFVVFTYEKCKIIIAYEFVKEFTQFLVVSSQYRSQIFPSGNLEIFSRKVRIDRCEFSPHLKITSFEFSPHLKSKSYT
jgi:hypothetical protein